MKDIGILIADDDPGVLAVCRSVLEGKGYANLTTLADSRQVLPFLERNSCQVLILDLMMPHIGGEALLAKVSVGFPSTATVVMTASDDIRLAVSCMRQGAFDFLVKPVNSELLLATVEKAARFGKLSEENVSLRDYLLNDHLENPHLFSEIVTGSKKMRAVLQYVEVIGPSDQPVLVTGDTGVGKELVARAVARVSGRSGRFVTVNVAGLDDVMFSDTLFGHRKGAFTGADTARDGLVSTAENGTLFLDEIGDLKESSQVKLLRLIQEQEYYPVGSDTLRKTNARIIVATNRNLQELIAAGSFRKDLYYRLCAHRVHIPPLRERPEDIPLLVDHAAVHAAAAMKKGFVQILPEVKDYLKTCTFEGNVRELHGMIYDAVARCSGGTLSIRDIAPSDDQAGNGPANAEIHQGAEPLYAVFGKFPTLREVEDYLINTAMTITKKNQRSAALLLGIARQTLSKRLAQRNAGDSR